MTSDFEMYAGDDRTLIVTVLDRDGDAVVITSATIKWQASRSKGKTASISKTTSSGITISDGPNGVFEITIDAADTENLKGLYYHEAEVTFADGSISTVMAGTMRIVPVLIAAAT